MGCSDARQCEGGEKGGELFQASGSLAKGAGVLAGPRRKNYMTASQAQGGEALEQPGTVGVKERS